MISNSRNMFEHLTLTPFMHFNDTFHESLGSGILVSHWRAPHGLKWVTWNTNWAWENMLRPNRWNSTVWPTVASKITKLLCGASMCMERHQKQQSAGLRRTRCVDTLICVICLFHAGCALSEMLEMYWSNTPWQDWNAPSKGFNGFSGSQMLGETPCGNQHHPRICRDWIYSSFFFSEELYIKNR